MASGAVICGAGVEVAFGVGVADGSVRPHANIKVANTTIAVVIYPNCNPVAPDSIVIFTMPTTNYTEAGKYCSLSILKG